MPNPHTGCQFCPPISSIGYRSRLKNDILSKSLYFGWFGNKTVYKVMCIPVFVLGKYPGFRDQSMRTYREGDGKKQNLRLYGD
jgi:hypothetical protein